MKIIRKSTVVLLAVWMLLFAGCGSQSLPEGIDEEALFTAGKDVVLLLVDGDYETVHGMLREDQRSQISVDDIREVVDSQLEDAGTYKQITDHMATGQVIDGDQYVIAVLYCEFSKANVLIRVSFDMQMNLVGFSLKQQ